MSRDDLLKKLGAAQANSGRAQGLVDIEAAFKNLKGDLRLRPVFHSKQSRHG